MNKFVNFITHEYTKVVCGFGILLFWLLLSIFINVLSYTMFSFIFSILFAFNMLSSFILICENDLKEENVQSLNTRQLYSLRRSLIQKQNAMKSRKDKLNDKSKEKWRKIIEINKELEKRENKEDENFG